MIVAYVSTLNRCKYCSGIHTTTTVRLGIPASAISSVVEGIDAAPVSERMKPVLHYARKLPAQPPIGCSHRAFISIEPLLAFL